MFTLKVPIKSATDDILNSILYFRENKYQHNTRKWPLCNLRTMLIWAFITETSLYNVDPLKSHFYIVKLGFTQYTLFFLFLLRNIDCGYWLEPPHRGSSNEYPQSMF